MKLSSKQLEMIKAVIDVISGDSREDVILSEGAPRSTKTVGSVAAMSLLYTLSEEPVHIVVAANREQAIRNFVENAGFGLKEMLKGGYRITGSGEEGWRMELSTPKGPKKIYFFGGGNVRALGVLTGLTVGSVMLMEANLLCIPVVEEVFRRVRLARMKGTGLVYLEQNPPSPMHPILKILEKYEKSGRFKFIHSTLEDNATLSPEQLAEEKATLQHDPNALKRDYYGLRAAEKGIVYHGFEKERNVVKEDDMLGRVIETFFVADGGKKDATTCGYYAVTEHTSRNEEGKLITTYHLYRIATYYHSGTKSGQVKSMNTYAEELVFFTEFCMRNWAHWFPEVDEGETYSNWFVDPSSPLKESMQDWGIDATNADNNTSSKSKARGVGKDSKVKVGIERKNNLLYSGQYCLVDNDIAVRDENGVEHTYNHKPYLEEVGSYRFKDDDSGTLVDKENHVMDTSRYAVNYFYTEFLKK